MIRIRKEFIIVAIALVFIFYGYMALQFNHKVKTFDTMIQIGDDMVKVLVLMGRPSCHNAAYPVQKELADRYGLKSGKAILLVYRGFYFLRNDLNFVFNPDTGKLIEKDRASIIWWPSYEEY
ncbi:MAG TPA: hypothetical protein P5119_12445 [Candidatus Aminicenantes bacterium]|nr:hypothetical protein [Candidatus Aminicenantes bacterium]HRY66134.1 hypothetical protein [Candidatus Aminicenantes bacterium]HRZ73048.1 hypothetical protein [Candidatus Aminicenantes bacterium]